MGFLLFSSNPLYRYNLATASFFSRPLCTNIKCRNQQCCLHFWLLLEDPFEQLSGIVKNVDRHGKPALFLIMPDSCLRIIQAKTKAVRRRKSVNNATISYTSSRFLATAFYPAHPNPPYLQSSKSRYDIVPPLSLVF